MNHIPSKKLTVYGIVAIVLSSLANLLHPFWVLWLTMEQIKTGWGYGTNMEMLALMPIFGILLSIPAILAAVVYVFLHVRWRSAKGIWIASLTLLGTLLLQIGLIWLFLFY